MSRRAVSVDPPRIGVEHEYQVLDGTGTVDARVLLPTLTLDGRQLDPGDKHATRCRWGGVITADGREAEIATPPVRLDDGGIDQVVELCAAGRASLTSSLGAEHRLRGYSTHINIEIGDDHVVQTARLVAERMAPALMLLIDRTDSPGVVIRPRHARLEIGGEFIDGARLRRAMIMASGVGIVAGRACRDKQVRAMLPPELDIRLQRSPQRFGWYVDRRAAGSDLYTHGRETELPLVGGGVIRAQEVLWNTWALARRALEAVVAESDLADVDRVVHGAEALPTAWHADIDETTEIAVPPEPWRTQLVDDWERDGISVTTTAATWHRVVLKATLEGETRWLSIAGDRIDSFVNRLNAGVLDEWLYQQFARRQGDDGAA